MTLLCGGVEIAAALGHAAFLVSLPLSLAFFEVQGRLAGRGARAEG